MKGDHQRELFEDLIGAHQMQDCHFCGKPGWHVCEGCETPCCADCVRAVTREATVICRECCPPVRSASKAQGAGK